MSVKLLYNKNRKEGRKELQRPTLNKATYYDTERIRETIGEVSENEYVRVKLVRTEPATNYRVCIIRYYKETHVVKTSEGRTVLLKPGMYCVASWFVSKVLDGLVWEASNFNHKDYYHVGND